MQIPTSTLYLGDCLDRIKEIADNSIDSIITDPPYGISFMQAKWDYEVPNKEVWEAAIRVLKPGGYLFSFASTRTFHRMATNIEDAGFEIRDMVAWVYGSGFPKSLNIGKAVDKLQGISEWEGWGSCLKPALEPIVMARKPLSEKTIALNVLKWGTGAINIDECRIGIDKIKTNKKTNYENWTIPVVPHNQDYEGNEHIGRFPANLIHDGSEEVVELFPETKSGKMKNSHTRHTDCSPNGIYGKFNIEHPLSETYGDCGSAARFFYCAKASKNERDFGLDDMPTKIIPRSNQAIAECKRGNNPLDLDLLPFSVLHAKNSHPTVKPIKLLTYLIKMATKPNGSVLDLFMGSGSTGVACVREERSFYGIEINHEYYEIAEQRIKTAGNKQC